MVLAPSREGLHGTAVLPMLENNHQPWSSLIYPPFITCFLDDGRVSVNSELMAASSLFAAGSLAKYPNARTGQADVAGGSHMSAELSGEVAARNMVGDKNHVTQSRNQHLPSLQESIPIWRSDVIPYLPPAQANEINASRMEATQQASTLALYSMGIHALCVGRCDSEGMATHGFWWTNTNQQTNGVENDSENNRHINNVGVEEKDDSRRLKLVGPSTFMKRLTQRTTMSKSNRGVLPVFGSGVVFYLDRSGNIQGVMLWGLPFSENPNDVHSAINCSLVERMKDVIRSNGEIAIQDHSDTITTDNLVNIDVDLLSYFHLAEESKFLASMALTGSMRSREWDSVRPEITVSGRPLHRYTPLKSVELTNLGKMRRKDDNGQLAEENDLFYATVRHSSLDSMRQVEKNRPPSLNRIYPMQGGAEANFGEYAQEKEREWKRVQSERSRPPKEEPLWLRQGEEHRFVSWKEEMADSFLRNMLLGQFNDGSEAVKQAPVPQVLVDAREQWKSWTGK